ncbi:unnamed protein product [Symbiodinium sp. CCMP2592]|nr:unnamed protein product [Symbiodinium sp. CCMP2592]
MSLSPSVCSTCSVYRWHEQRLQSLERRPCSRRNHCHAGQRLSAVLTVATLRCCSRADRLRNAARESHASHRPQDTDFKLQDAAREARVVFCILCRGSSSKDAWPKSPEGVRSLGNTRDDVARSLMAALGRDSPEAAVVLVFEDTRQTRSRQWWVLTSGFLEHEVTEYSVLRQCQRLAQSIHDEHSADDESGRRAALEARPHGACLLPSRDSLQETAATLFEALGCENSVLVLLDETFPPLPVTAPSASADVPEARRAVFVLGLREELNTEQLECFARAAVEKRWSVLRLSMGWVGEFTSKVVARLQALHSCQQLLKSLGVLKHWKQTGSLNTLHGWPCPDSREQELFLRDGPLVHFCLPVQAPLQELSCDPTSSSAAACSLLARSCIAGLWRAHHAWDRCRLSFAFTCGAVVTVTRRFKGRFQGRRATEYCVLKELRELVDAALQEHMQKGNLAKAAMPGRRACTVQLPTNGLLPTLPYRRDGTLQLYLESRSDVLCSEVSASELLQALWKPLAEKDAPSCMVCLVLFTSRASSPFRFSADWQGVASPRLPDTDHFTLLCALQSALLGADGSGAELLAQADVFCVSEKRMRMPRDALQLYQEFRGNLAAIARPAQAGTSIEMTLSVQITHPRFNNIAREWRCKWSADGEKASLKAAQAALEEVLPEIKKVDGLGSVQRVVCGGCLDFKVVVKLPADKFGDWEKTKFAPEEAFLGKLKGIEGISIVETQTYTLEEVVEVPRSKI